ncbi:MAG: group II truncated hemoglobin [Gammaproteobacteria bacterium]
MSNREPKLERPASTFERIGGDEGLKKLVQVFYDEMESLPEAKTIRELHPEDTRSAREKLFMFLSGWMGGPDRYIAAFGHPRLRARHLPFPIGEKEKDQWLLCMEKALDALEIDSAFKMQLLQSFRQTANHMMNSETSREE